MITEEIRLPSPTIGDGIDLRRRSKMKQAAAWHNTESHSYQMVKA
jgi:hypothetical protein